MHIEENDLVLYFQEDENVERADDLHPSKNPHRKRRAHRRRNRMRTRGWDIIARITNSKGQHCAIYKPFVEALQKPNLTIGEQKRLVEGILRSNRNKPSEVSVQYFLENTIEYLQSQAFRALPSSQEKEVK